MDDLLAYLGVEGDEVAVVSAVLESDGERWWLMRGSVVVGPPALGLGNWTAWRAAERGPNTPFTEPAESNYVLVEGRFACARQLTTPDVAARWLNDLRTTGSASALEAVPALFGNVRHAQVPARISSQLGTSASRFMGACIRPATGFWFEGEEVDLDGPTVWSSTGVTYIDPPAALGLAIQVGAPGGVVLARLERQAWLRHLHAGDGFATFDCEIGLDPDRIDVSDLVLAFDEWVDGELAYSQQVPLERLDSDPVRGHPHITVQLPTLGRRVQRTIRLSDRNGRLLDASSSQFSTVEAVHLTVEVAGLEASIAPSFGVTVGSPSLPQSIVDRAEAIARVDSQYNDLFSKGAAGELVIGKANQESVLRSRLSQAKGTLRVVDRYFAYRDPVEWKLFSQVPCPVEVLVSNNVVKPLTPLSNVTVRRTPKGRPPFHGRAYLWDSGGLLVDISPSGFGSSPVIMTAITKQVSDRYLNEFSKWWASASQVPL